MTRALRGYRSAIAEGLVGHDGDKDLQRHLANARRQDVLERDEQGKPLWLIRKDRPDSPNKMDLAMAGTLSWEARTDAIAAGVPEQEKQYQFIVVGGPKR